MDTRFRIYLLLLPITLTVIIDEWLKVFALSHLPDEQQFLDPWIIDFAVHKNPGLAFDLPFRLEFVIVLTILIGFLLMRTAWKTLFHRPGIAFSCLTIVIGSLGNLYDRIIYGFTVDYIFILGRSAVNFSDIIIIIGIISLLLLSSKRTHFHRSLQTPNLTN